MALMVRANGRLKEEFPLITLPVSNLYRTHDKATKPSGSRLLYHTAGSADKALRRPCSGASERRRQPDRDGGNGRRDRCAPERGMTTNHRPTVKGETTP